MFADDTVFSHQSSRRELYGMQRYPHMKKKESKRERINELGGVEEFV